MIIEGKNAVEGVITGSGDKTLSNVSVEKIYIQRDVNTRDSSVRNLIEKIKKSGKPYQFADKIALDRMTQNKDGTKPKNHQGFIAVITDFKYSSVEEILNKPKDPQNPLILILDGVEDPHNFGNIIRTAECMGACGIVIPKNRSVSVTDTVIRVSAGASSYIKISKVTNINQEIQKLKDKGFWIYGAEAGGEDILKTNLKGSIAIIMGSEGQGVSKLTLKLCDAVISIPMYGVTNSLNVANATAMVLYEVNRQRSK